MRRPNITRTALALLPALFILPLSAARISNAPRLAGPEALRAFRVTNSGDLREGWHSDHTIRLSYGTEYVMRGICDEDCTDLDLKLYDSNGNLLDEDVEPDDTPIIVHTARYSGNYTLRVIMARCRIEPCKWETTVRP
jgi:hypothetical protein